MKHTLKATAAIIGAAAVVLSIAFGLDGLAVMPAIALTIYGTSTLIKEYSK